MSIRIIPEEEIKQAAGSFHNPPLLFSNPKNLYQHRAKRLRELAKAHPLADYLLFVADIVDSQARILQQHPIPQDPRLAKNNLSQPLLAEHPLSAQTWSRHPVWRELLTILLTDMKDKANEQSLQTIEWLEKTSDSELERLADKLLRQDFSQISSDKAVFIWAALSLYWLQLTQQIPHRSIAESSDNLHVCPVCASAPTASVIHLGSTQGLRYLHCSLCESEWNVVRAKCTNCDQSQHIDYWS
ncbi:MAG TPA: formate dehydrogenase accessory protein FdhE, partial [Pasteurellaceae bacterium]|nr:formate dehydrogenase accessory protein FdhE [Pasteurellaceae bacterium]